MQLRDLINQVDGFGALPPREKIQLFAWHHHTNKGKELFDNAAIRTCFDELHLIAPNVGQYLSRMAGTKPPDVVKVKGGYKLERSIRAAFDAKYGVHQSVVQVSKLLSDLPGKMTDLAEKNFLIESMKCYRVAAYRSCVVMTWNLAYSHLLCWILAETSRINEFNSAIARRFPKKLPLVISKYDDFDQLKESEVIEVCNTAGLVNGNIVRILREKLGKRNTAAHPASVLIVQSQADDVVTDLINNVVVALA